MSESIATPILANTKTAAPAPPSVWHGIGGAAGAVCDA